MIHTATILMLVCGAMFVITKAIDLIFNWLNITFKPQSIQSSKPEQITEKVLDSLQLAEYYSPNAVSTMNSCAIESTSSDVAISDGLSEGLQAIAESAGEHISTIIESFDS